MNRSAPLARLAGRLASLLLLAACAAARPALHVDSSMGGVDDANWRVQVPASGPAPALRPPVPQHAELPNHLQVLSVYRPRLPLCTVSLVFKSGAAQDPRQLPGLAQFTADLLKMGSARHDAGQMAEAIEALGTQIGVAVSEDAIVLSTTALTENIAAAFDLLVEQVRSPRFAAEEIERLRKVRLAELAQRDFEPGHSAHHVLRRLLFGSHPYGHLAAGSPNSVARLQRSSVRHYYSEHFRPDNAAAVVVGNLPPAEAVRLVEAKLADWRADPEAPKGPQLPTEAPVEHAAGISLVARPGAPQSLVLMGQLGAARSSADFYALTVMNGILGGQFDSRINMNLREDKGYSYGARSSFDFLRQRGAYYISASVTSRDTGAAIAEVFKEIDRLREQEVQPEELRAAQAHYSLTLPGRFQTVDSTAALLAGLFVYDLPLSYFGDLPAQIDAVTVGDVRRVAQTYLRPKNLGVVVVGDPSVVQVGLDKLGRGKVVARDAQGQPLAHGRGGLLPRRAAPLPPG